MRWRHPHSEKWGCKVNSESPCSLPYPSATFSTECLRYCRRNHKFKSARYHTVRRVDTPFVDALFVDARSMWMTPSCGATPVVDDALLDSLVDILVDIPMDILVDLSCVSPTHHSRHVLSAYILIWHCPIVGAQVIWLAPQLPNPSWNFATFSEVLHVYEFESSAKSPFQ